MGPAGCYAADIELQGFISGTLKCQSYDQMSQAAEIYVDWGDPLSLEYRGKGVPRGLQYFLVDQAGNESSPKAIVPCQLLHLDSLFIHRKFALRKYKDSMWQGSQWNLSDECANCTRRQKKYLERKLWTRAIFREYTSLPSSDQFQPVPDCNGDQLSMCSDVFANISDTCSTSNNLIAEANFEDVEYCLVQATGSIVEGQYDPRIGFYVDSVDYDHVYVCPMVRGSRPLFLAPMDPGLRRTPTVTIQPDSMVKSELTLTCEMGKSLKRDTTMILKAMPCSHLSYCQTLFDNFGNLEHLRNGLVGVQASSKKVGNNITRVVLAQATTHAAAVICTGFVGLNQPFVHYVNFYFTALDSQPYLISDALPPKAIISLESIVPVGANGSTGTIPTRKFTCTVSTFILFPFFQYTVYFSNRTVINVTKETVKLPNKLSSVRDENGRASQTLTMDFSADVVKVACGSSFRNSLQWASASIDVSSMELGRMSTTFLMPMTIAGILVVLLSAFCGIFAAIRYREAQNLRGLTLAEIEEFFNGTKVAMPSKAQTVNEVNVDALGFTSNFHIGSSDLKIYDEQVLGQGEFGLCIKGDFRGETVAVKMTKDSMDVCSFKDFLREVKIMAYVGAHPHPHVVHFHGAVVDNLKHRTCLAIIEFGPYGDLLGYLRHDKSEYVFALGCLEDQLRLQNVPKLEFVDLCYFCEQIASAMDFIGEKKVLHGDLAARNVLVFPNNVVKISDFGLSRRLYDAYKYQETND